MGAKNIKGFTFLELMIAFSIFSIISLILFGLFFSELKGFYNRSTLTSMNLESNRAMDVLTTTISKYSDISVVGNKQVYADGELIIDGNNDGTNDGSLFSLNESDHTLIYADNFALCSNMKSIDFVIGPTVYNGVGVAENVLLIEMNFQHDSISYTLKGGLNLAK